MLIVNRDVRDEFLGLGEMLKLAWPMMRIPFDMSAPFDVLHQVGQMNADRIKISIGSREALFLKHPADIEQVLVAPTDKMGHSRLQTGVVGIRANETVITNADGDEWAQRRRQLAAFMGKAGLKKGFIERAEADVAAHIESWDRPQLINVEEEATSFALKYGLRSLFDLAITPTECADMHTGVEALHRYMHMRVTTLGKIPKPLIKSLTQVQRSTDAGDRVIGRLIESYRNADAETRDQHLLPHLVTPEQLIQAEAGEVQPVRAAINEIIIASHLSVRTSFYWAMHHIARAPEIQDIIHREAISAGGKLSFRPDAHGNMPMVAKVVMETLRLHPTFYIILKEPKQDFAGEQGLTIAKGTTVLVSPWLTHRDVRFYDDPETFNPDAQFAPHAMKSRTKGSYLPFGLGPHGCPGSGAALQQMCTTLSDLCARVRLETPPAQQDFPLERADTMLNPRRDTYLKAVPR